MSVSLIQNFHQPPKDIKCLMCGIIFKQTMRKQGGGCRGLYCSPKCRSLYWVRKYPKKRKESVRKYESNPKNKKRKARREKERRLKYPLTQEYKLWSGARTRAREKHLDFTIELKDVKIPLKCPLLNIPLIVNQHTHSGASPSFDRIDSKKGYTKENSWIISHRANTAKSDLTLTELKMLVKNLEMAIIDKKISETL